MCRSATLISFLQLAQGVNDGFAPTCRTHISGLTSLSSASLMASDRKADGLVLQVPRLEMVHPDHQERERTGKEGSHSSEKRASRR